MSLQKIEFTDTNFDIETSTGLSVVCFGELNDSTCRKVVKRVEKAADALPEWIRVGRCDVEKCPKLAERFRITNLPTTVIIKRGREVERMVGIRHKFTLVKHLKHDLAEAF